ncbi:MAG TPA: polymer-forming cytoskeletal protein [Thermomicrobiaceae bacterium]|nr:polymer-forming cytoskeletal protein [Thermomicrobiaceae bacterium]
MSYRPGGQTGGFPEALSPQAPESFSLIDRHSSVEGTYASERDLRIEGEMRGTVRCQGLLYIAEGADVDANVEAANITIAGQVRGSVNCRGKLQIMPSGRVHATIATDTLVINEGAIYEGELRMEVGGASGPGRVQPEGEAAATPILRRFAPDAGDGPALPAAQPSKRGREE